MKSLKSALFGALIVESTTTWRGGGAPWNMGNGLMVHAGTAHLEDLDFSGTFGDYLLMPAYGAVFAAEAVVDTVNLTVSDVIGDLLDYITCPTVPDTSSFTIPWAVVIDGMTMETKAFGNDIDTGAIDALVP